MKKLLKKSIACLIAVLMVVSVMPLTMPLTTPISVEAADEQFATAKSALSNWKQETFTVIPTHETTSSAGTNIVYASGTTNWTSNSSGSNDYAGVGRINVKFATPNVIVGVYDGTKPEYPIVMETIANQGANSHRINRAYINSTTSLSLKQRWKGWGTNYQQWPGSNTSKEFGYLTDDAVGSRDTENKNDNHFWWNMMVYNGTGNTTYYYDKDTNFTFYVATAYRTIPTGSFNERTNDTVYMKGDVYTINYSALISKINEAKTKVNNIDTSKTYCTKLVNDFTSAVNQLTSIKVSSYFSGKQDSQISQAVTDCTQAISDAISAYNTASANLGEHNYQKDEITYKAPTCTVAGKEADKFCVYCNDIIEGATIPATGHNLTQTVAKDATCTEAGNSAYWTCSTCNKMFSDANAATEINAVPTISATGHTNGEPVRENVQDSTCTATGSYDEVVYCSVCGAEISRTEKTIEMKAHNWGDWVYDANKQEKRSCTVCGTVDSEKRNCAYIVKSETPATCSAEGKRVYRCTQCNNEYDEILPVNSEAHKTATKVETTNATCTVAGKKETVTYCTLCNKEISRVKTEDIPVLAHNYGEPVYNAETNFDVFTCKNCGYTYSKTVAKMEELNAAIDELEALVNADDATYKYEASALVAAKEAVANAKAYAENKENRYKEQGLVDAETKKVLSEKTTLITNGLAQYTVTFELVNGDTGVTIETDSSSIKYGELAEKSYTFGKTEEGFPEYVVSKWTKKVLNDKGEQVETVLNSTANDMSVVVKENATYTCYVLNFKATNETKNTTRVRYLDKSGKTLKIDYATVGSTYTPNYSKVPKIPYYRFTEWKRVYGEDTPVGTRELVYQAQYEYDEVEANKCIIVGLPGVYVNGTTGTPGYTAYYDEKIELTGAEKYAYANADGSIIAPINENYIFAPHLNGVDKTIYITKVETPIEDAKSIITGVFTTHEDTTYNYLVINAQYYLPEGAKAVEAGAVIGKYNNADTLKIGSAVKVVSDTQGDNHEYSLQMSYSKGKTGTLYARSYLIYVDSNGDTQTVYSDDITTCNLD